MRITEQAVKIPGRCFIEELDWLYELALMAPPELPMVELGTFQGRTAAVLCAAAREIGSEVITIDDYQQDPDFTESAEGYAKATRKNLKDMGFGARVIVGDSALVPEGIEKIGLLFIDSEHTTERFNRECNAWLPLLVEGGILALHDYEQPQWPEMTPTINERISSKPEEWEYLGLTVWLVGFKKLKEADMVEEPQEEQPKEEKKSKKPELPKINIVDGMIVAAPGEGIWCIDGDKRRLVPDVATQIRMHIGMHHVVMLHPEQLEAIPKGEPMPRAKR